MKRLLLLLVLSLAVGQLFILPAATNAVGEIVITLPATDVLAITATLNGTGSSLGKRNADAFFEYGLAPGKYTHTTPVVSYMGVTSLTANANLTGLFPCHTYYARLVIHCWNTTPTVYDAFFGNEIHFRTMGCQVGVLGQPTIPGLANGSTSSGAINMSNIIVKSAAIATPKVAPGEKVDVTASVTNNGSSNGDAKVTLYVNGQEVESQGITLSSGQTSPLHFYVSRNEPGTYTVDVGNVSAGSFTVDIFANNDFLIYGLIALVTLGIAGGLYLVTRKRTA